mmetsp:Transcript_6980/g.17646  ORF Transcript_6980/g.17646 Transcript_6980/m.17646 type:complete len:81 (+) Transcript_6980:1495-1737(+)
MSTSVTSSTGALSPNTWPKRQFNGEAAIVEKSEISVLLLTRRAGTKQESLQNHVSCWLFFFFFCRSHARALSDPSKNKEN